jgi:hypothetical protein
MVELRPDSKWAGAVSGYWDAQGRLHLRPRDSSGRLMSNEEIVAAQKSNVRTGAIEATVTW